jgi:hypothetical protein
MQEKVLILHQQKQQAFEEMEKAEASALLLRPLRK